MNRQIELDVIRGYAVLLVLVCHIQTIPPLPMWIAFPIGFLRCMGWVGVDLFFVLSGFLVSGLIFREILRTGRVDIGRFLVRRGFKIYPSYYLLLVVTPLLPFLPKITPLQALFEAFYLRNYLDGYWAHTWSLAVEEHFYLLLALLSVILLRARKVDVFKPLPWICGGIFAASLGLRTAAVLSTVPNTFLANFWPTHLRIDALAMGVLIAYFHYFYPDQFWRFARRFHRAFFVLGVLLLLPAYLPILSPYTLTIGLTQFYIASGMLLVSALVYGPKRSLWAKIVSRIGYHSYSIYIWHLVVAAVVPDMYLYLILSIGVGIWMGEVFEAPILRLRDRMIPSISRRVPAETPAPLS